MIGTKNSLFNSKATRPMYNIIMTVPGKRWTLVDFGIENYLRQEALPEIATKRDLTITFDTNHEFCLVQSLGMPRFQLKINGQVVLQVHNSAHVKSIYKR